MKVKQTIPDTFGWADRLRTARKAAGLTGQQAAALAGMAYGTFNGYEQGIRCPGPDAQAAIAVALGRCVSDLFPRSHPEEMASRVIADLTSSADNALDQRDQYERGEHAARLSAALRQVLADNALRTADQARAMLEQGDHLGAAQALTGMLRALELDRPRRRHEPPDYAVVAERALLNGAVA